MTTSTRYELPKPNDIFVTPHSGERNWRTANDNLILLSEVGSRLHGISLGSDDQDLQGVCIEPPEVMLATRQFKLYDYRTVPVGHKSGKDDIDLSVFGLAKWVDLIIKGNPSNLLPLFSPPDHTLYIDWPGQDLRDNVQLFLAKEHAKKFLGYLNHQRMRMTGEIAQGVTRPELVEAYGYDTKFAAHALRIAMQGTQLMRIGRLVLPMEGHQRKYLTDVRLGKYTMGEVLKKLGNLEDELLTASKYSSILPERVDLDYVDGWLTSVYRRWWAEKGL
jgi:hypothetical protein